MTTTLRALLTAALTLMMVSPVAALYSEKIDVGADNIACAAGRKELALLRLPSRELAAPVVQSPAQGLVKDCKRIGAHTVAVVWTDSSTRSLVVYDSSLTQTDRRDGVKDFYVEIAGDLIVTMGSGGTASAWRLSAAGELLSVTAPRVLGAAGAIATIPGKLAVVSSGVQLFALPALNTASAVTETGGLQITDIESHGASIIIGGNSPQSTGWVRLIENSNVRGRADTQAHGLFSVAMSSASVYAGMTARTGASPLPIRVEVYSLDPVTRNMVFERHIATPQLPRDLAIGPDGAVWQSDENDGIRLVQAATGPAPTTAPTEPASTRTNTPVVVLPTPTRTNTVGPTATPVGEGALRACVEGCLEQ